MVVWKQEHLQYLFVLSGRFFQNNTADFAAGDWFKSWLTFALEFLDNQLIQLYSRDSEE
jgi:hypothetical protein